ncbi:hypothetical protein ABW19_dt0203854 [Dactylella cylindrospora]|nr:hypothetical protein ABW19_dt0203854 [Dactylella cylindrospora]
MRISSKSILSIYPLLWVAVHGVSLQSGIILNQTTHNISDGYLHDVYFTSLSLADGEFQGDAFDIGVDEDSPEDFIYTVDDEYIKQIESRILKSFKGCATGHKKHIIQAFEDSTVIMGEPVDRVSQYRVDWERPAANEFFGSTGPTLQYRETVRSNLGRLSWYHNEEEEPGHITIVCDDPLVLCEKSRELIAYVPSFEIAGESYINFCPKFFRSRTLPTAMDRYPRSKKLDDWTGAARGSEGAALPNANADSYAMFLLSEFMHKITGAFPHISKLDYVWPYARDAWGFQPGLRRGQTLEDLAAEFCIATKGGVGLTNETLEYIMPIEDCFIYLESVEEKLDPNVKTT